VARHRWCDWRAAALDWVVIAGRDPAIHLRREKLFAKNDGPAGQALRHSHIAGSCVE